MSIPGHKPGRTVYIEQQPVIPDNNHRTLVSRASKIKPEVGHQNLRDKFVITKSGHPSKSSTC